MGVHTEEKLDEEWVALMIEAKELGMDINEIKSFLHQNGK